ncbi:MAG: Gfo/Idh/MocA family oxidoreductase [Candidatus Glassbacteria bacterium]|nr:Gfo/Idh/MocA family oxidoreductase [Candidatus Glassbacteria bacterium]
MDRLRLGIVGYGDAAVSFVTAAHFLKDWHPVAVGGRNMDKAAVFAKAYEVEPRTVEAMAGADDIDVIAVATPPGIHLQDTLKAILGGKHVLVEKPFALSLEDCDRMIEAAGRAGRLLMVGQTLRYYPGTMHLHRLITSGEFGRVLMIEDSQVLNYFGSKRTGWQLDPALSGGGVVMNPVIHFTDRFRYLAGSEVRSVRAVLGAARPGYRIEGHTQVFYTFDNRDLSATLTLSGYGQTNLDCTRVYLESGMLQLDFLDNRVSVFAGGAMLRSERPDPMPYGPGRLITGYVQQFVEFADTLRSGAVNRSDGASGRATVAACLAILESAARGVEVYPGP